MIPFGEFLKRIRNVAGYTQQNVADVLELDRSTYSYYETGKTEPNIRCLKALAKMYDLTLDDLIYCRYRPIKSAVRSEEPKERPMTDLAQMRTLTRAEQELVLLYRNVRDKDALTEALRKFADADPDDAEA